MYTIVKTKQQTLKLFSVDFILFFFSDYYWKIVNILIYLTDYETEDLLCEDITKLNLSRLFKQDTERN